VGTPLARASRLRGLVAAPTTAGVVVAAFLLAPGAASAAPPLPVVTSTGGSPATAASRAEAKAVAAHAAAASAADAVAAVQQALAREREAVQAAVSASVGAAVRAQEDDDARALAHRVATRRVRAAYMGSGSGLGGTHGVALLRAVTSGADVPAELRRRDLAAGAAARADREELAAATDAAARARGAAQEADDVVAARTGALREAAARASRLADALTAAQAQVQALDARAARLRAAEDAARALAQAQAAAAALASAAAGAAAQVQARAVPTDYAALYAAAAATCPGMRTSALSAVGQVESGHGRDAGPSSAGALGPMQFLPSTFAAYAVDGDGDGVTDVRDPADAVSTAARYLCANGAGHGRDGEAAALFRYNHADWYVAMVQRLADQLDAARTPA